MSQLPVNDLLKFLTVSYLESSNMMHEDMHVGRLMFVPFIIALNKSSDKQPGKKDKTKKKYNKRTKINTGGNLGNSFYSFEVASRWAMYMKQMQINTN